MLSSPTDGRAQKEECAWVHCGDGFERVSSQYREEGRGRDSWIDGSGRAKEVGTEESNQDKEILWIDERG